MNCATIQEQLLQCAEPAHPPAGLLRHLAQCAACRAFQQQLLELEDGVRGLAAPPSVLRARLVARLQEGELPTPAVPRPSPWRWTLKERAQQKLALALTLAASLALFALGWGMWPHGVATKDDGPHGPVATRTAEVAAVAKHLGNLEREVLAGQLSADEVETRSAFFVELVEEELPRRTRALSQTERATVVPGLLEQLRRSESDLGRACAEQPHPSESLCRMARAARTGQLRLRALLG